MDPVIANAYAGHNDPILTQIGHQQAIETGQFIKAEITRLGELEGRAFDAIILECSPF